MKKFEFMFEGLFFGIFGIITVLLAGTMISTSLTAGFLSLLLLVVLFLAGKQGVSIREKINTKYGWMIWQFLSAIVMLWLAFRLEVDLSWDWGVVMRTAAHYVDTGVVGNPEYYAQYPNNQLWVVILIGMFKLANILDPAARMEQFKTVSIVAMCLLVQLTIWLIRKTAVLIWDETRGFFAGCFATLCLPLYLYAQFAYTDVPGMFLCALLLYLFFRFQKSRDKEKNVCLLLLGITGAIAYKIKVLVFIVVLAVVVELFLQRGTIKKFLGHMLVLGFSVIFTVSLLQFPVNRILAVSDDMYQTEEFPAAHWVMMGLNQTGGYQEEDVTFTRSFPTYQEKKAANVAQIRSRISAYGVGGMLQHICYTKWKRTWCVSSLNGDDYVGRNPLYEGTLQEIFTKKGRMHGICLAYMGTYHFLMIFGIFLSGARAVFKREEKAGIRVGRISIFGVVLFLSLWECNSRYLVCFIPVLLLTAMDGIHLLLQAEKGN